MEVLIFVLDGQIVGSLILSHFLVLYVVGRLVLLTFAGHGLSWLGVSISGTLIILRIIQCCILALLGYFIGCTLKLAGFMHCLERATSRHLTHNWKIDPVNKLNPTMTIIDLDLQCIL